MADTLKLVVLFLFGIHTLSYATVNHASFAELHICTKDNSLEKVYLTEKRLLTGDEQALYTGLVGKKTEVVKIPCSGPSIIYLTCKNMLVPVYVDKDVITTIEIQSKNTPGVNFIGTNASINNYLLAKESKLDSLISKDLKVNYSMPVRDFQALNQRVEVEIAGLRKEYLLDEVDTRFKLFDAADVASLLFMRKLLYSDYHHHFTKERLPVLCSYEELRGVISFDNEYGLLSSYYTDLLFMYIRNLISKDTAPAGLSAEKTKRYPLEKIFDANNVEFKNKKVAEYFNAQLFLMSINIGMGSFAEEKLKSYKATSDSAKAGYLEIVDQKLLALSKIGAGRKAPNFAVVDLEGNKISLASFKGKTVYVNIWSPACAPSMDELVGINRVFDKFEKDNRVVFLNISLDNDLKSLADDMKSRPIHGINGIPADFKDFEQSYFIKVTPRYILIDRNGKMISPFAKRPSDEQLVQEIEKALKESK